MNNHWPLVVAVLVISGAAGFGLVQREIAVSAAAPKAIRPPAATAPVTPAPVKPAPVTDVVEKPLPTPNPDQSLPLPLPTQKPTVPAPKTATPATPAAPQPPPVLKPAPPIAGPVLNDLERAQVLKTLRAALEAKLGAPAMDLANGVFAVNLDGARLEAQPLPNWSISVFNINPRAPETETANFKRIYDVVTAVLTIDLTQPAQTGQNGIKTTQTTCKLGSIALVRDVNNGNSAVIRPNQAIVQRKTFTQPSTSQPAQPKPPQPNTPPGPPDKDF